MNAIKLADDPFYTIQGEGPSAGHPALFIRLQGCSVGCSWCDTKYSWDPDKGKSWPLDTLRDRIKALPDQAIVVITGGEPMEYVDEVHAILDSCRRDRWVEMETSGYLFDYGIGLKLSQITLSPKVIRSAAVIGSKQARPEVIAKWLSPGLSGKAKLKFVVKDRGDLDNVLSFLMRTCTELSEPMTALTGKVWLMPEGMYADQMVENGKWLAEQCKELGFNLSLRQHVILWGPKRGV